MNELRPNIVFGPFSREKKVEEEYCENEERRERGVSLRKEEERKFRIRNTLPALPLVIRGVRRRDVTSLPAQVLFRVVPNSFPHSRSCFLSHTIFVSCCAVCKGTPSERKAQTD